MINERIRALSPWLAGERADFAFVHSPANVFYLTNFYCEPHERFLGLFIFPSSDPFLVCPKLEVRAAENAGWPGEIVSYSDTEDPLDLVRSHLLRRGIKPVSRFAVEKRTMPFTYGETFLHWFSGAQVISCEEKLNSMRMVKTSQEIDRMRQAARLADEGVAAGIAALAEGVQEAEVVAEIEYALKRKGIQQMAFQTMVLFGRHSAEPHGKPGRCRLETGDFVLFDLGVMIDGYCSDITRTVVFRKATEEMKHLYETVLQAEEAALAACVPAQPIGDVDRAARKIIEKAGLGKYFIHRTGHGLGIEPHESPSVTAENKTVLKEGMVFTVEPGVYVPEIGGVRIEDDVVVGPDGPETLTSFPKSLQIIR